MEKIAQILWRRLSGPGHEICWLYAGDAVHMISGQAIWRAPSGLAHFSYAVTHDMEWRCRHARIQGMLDDRQVDLTLTRNDDGQWTTGDRVIPDSDHLQDIDLGFTPATNTPTLRRLMKSDDTRHEVDVLWLDEENWQLKPLRQIYERKDEGLWSYASPDHDFAAVLTVNAHGFVTDYPGLWIEED